MLNHLELLGDTPYDRPPQYIAHPPKGPISRQDHGNPMQYRNIWVRELKPAVGKRTREAFYREGEKKWPVSEDKWGGYPSTSTANRHCNVSGAATSSGGSHATTTLDFLRHR